MENCRKFFEIEKEYYCRDSMQWHQRLYVVADELCPPTTSVFVLVIINITQSFES